jgi:hypothetical protein
VVLCGCKKRSFRYGRDTLKAAKHFKLLPRLMCFCLQLLRAKRARNLWGGALKKNCARLARYYKGQSAAKAGSKLGLATLKLKPCSGLVGNKGFLGEELAATRDNHQACRFGCMQ